MRAALAFLIAALVGAGCAPVIPEGELVCAVGECPPDWTCHRDGFCRSTEDVDPTCDELTSVDRIFEAPLGTGTPVDLLVVMDRSNSLMEEQTQLAEQLPLLVDALVTGNLDGAGPNPARAVDSIHYGVVDTDMGTGGFRVPTCDLSDFGNDGVLQGTASTGPGCDATYPSFLTYMGDAAEFAMDAQCVTAVNTGGCGFEQPLDAMLKALIPSTSEVRFFRDTTGHGDGANAGFLRRGSVLTIITLTDENDCSSAVPELFDPVSSRFGATDLNLRCFVHADEALHPIERYVNGLLELDASDIVFAPIAGFPIGLLSTARQPDGTLDYDAIRADPMMAEVVDPAMPSRLRTSCNVPGRGLAFPPVRFVDLMEALEERGAGVSPASICQTDFTPVLEGLVGILDRAIKSPCLTDPAFRRMGQLVPCDLVESPAPGMSCEQTFGGALASERIVQEDRVDCVIRQLDSMGGAPSGAGWFLDDFSARRATLCGGAGGPLIGTSDGLPLSPTARIECRTSPDALPGTPCSRRSGSSECVSTELNLECDPASFTCQLACPQGNDDCGGGFVCDSALEVCTNLTCTRD